MGRQLRRDPNYMKDPAMQRVEEGQQNCMSPNKLLLPRSSKKTVRLSRATKRESGKRKSGQRKG